jgi:hypothetical protein
MIGENHRLLKNPPENFPESSTDTFLLLANISQIQVFDNWGTPDSGRRPGRFRREKWRRKIGAK